MLLEFTVGNFRSFKERVTFSMIASSLKEHQETHVFQIPKYRLLKSSVLFGANASGKSNFIKAALFMRDFVALSAKETRIADSIEVQNFKLNSEAEQKGSVFEIVFLMGERRFRYGFQVNADRVEAEWLFFVPRTKEARLFVREGDDFNLGPHFKEGRGLEKRTRKNALFLSVVAQFNGETSLEILTWFRKLSIISGLNDVGYIGFTFEKLKEPEFKKWALDFLGIADIDIQDIRHKSRGMTLDGLPKSMEEQLVAVNQSERPIKALQEISILTKHCKFDRHGKKEGAEWFSVRDESEGTQKLLALAGPLWDAIMNGKILFIDEFDARLHEKLSLALINLFNSKSGNAKRAQFVFTTHDTSLLTGNLFRRDQIWFINKNRFGASDLYSLVDHKKNNNITRKDASYRKNYLLGKYGALPIVNDFAELFEAVNGE